MGLDEFVLDTLPVNQPYDGLVADAYDVWLPHDADDPDVGVYRRFIERNPGSALELGCGTSRLLVRYAALGLDVEGVDASADMLAICASHARAAGVEPALHRADWLTLDLGRDYSTLYNRAGSFALIADDDARTALEAWRRHLRPGGQLLISMGVPRPDRTPRRDDLRRASRGVGRGTAPPLLLRGPRTSSHRAQHLRRRGCQHQFRVVTRCRARRARGRERVWLRHVPGARHEHVARRPLRPGCD